MILVAGGLGYIGSHTCVELLKKGERVIVLDNLSRALEDNIAKFESQFGEIKLPEQKMVLPPMGFGPNTPNA